MSYYTEWSEELADLLSAPFPDYCIQTKRKGNTDISFVAWHEYVRKLNHLVGPGWSMGQPMIHEVGGKLVMGVPVTILGVTRINFGDEDEGKDDYGTASTNAFSQAFKRTCALFGMGLNLYDKQDAQRNARPAQRQAPQPAQASAPTPSGPRGPKPASDPQQRKIGVLMRQKNMDFATREKLSQDIASGLTSLEASEWITRLMALGDG